MACPRATRQLTKTAEQSRPLSKIPTQHGLILGGYLAEPQGDPGVLPPPNKLRVSHRNPCPRRQGGHRADRQDSRPGLSLLGRHAFCPLASPSSFLSPHLHSHPSHTKGTKKNEGWFSSERYRETRGPGKPPATRDTMDLRLIPALHEWFQLV